MTSQWYTNVNIARPRHAPTWRKTFKWTHFTTISKREWISTVIVYVYEVIWSIHFHSIKWNYDNRIGESPWRSWCYLICIITRGLCSYNARLFNDDVTAIGVSYWRRREFTNYARLHRGRISHYELNCLDDGWDIGLELLMHEIMLNNALAQWGRDKLAAILQASFSNVFSWMQIVYFGSHFTQICYQGSN